VGGILISVSVAEELQSHIPVRDAGTIHVKGFEEAIDVYEVLPDYDEVVKTHNDS